MTSARAIRGPYASRSWKTLAPGPYTVDKVVIPRIIGFLGRVDITGLTILSKEKHANRDSEQYTVCRDCALRH